MESATEKDRQIYGSKVDLILEKATRYERGRPQDSFPVAFNPVGREQMTNTYRSSTATNVASNVVSQESGSTAAIQFQENLFCPCTDDCNCICHLRSTTWRRIRASLFVRRVCAGEGYISSTRGSITIQFDTFYAKQQHQVAKQCQDIKTIFTTMLS